MRIVLGVADATQNVLNMMAKFVRDDVFLRERTARGTKPVDKFLEEGRIKVGFFIAWAIERPDVGACRATCGVGAAAKDDGFDWRISCADLLEVAGPEGIEAISGRGDPAIELLIGVGSGLALISRTVACWKLLLLGLPAVERADNAIEQS